MILTIDDIILPKYKNARKPEFSDFNDSEENKSNIVHKLVNPWRRQYSERFNFSTDFLQNTGKDWIFLFILYKWIGREYYTAKYIISKTKIYISDHSTWRNWNDVTVAEMKAFIDVLNMETT